MNEHERMLETVARIERERNPQPWEVPQWLAYIIGAAMIALVGGSILGGFIGALRVSGRGCGC